MAENIREPRIMVEPTPPGDINSLHILPEDVRRTSVLSNYEFNDVWALDPTGIIITSPSAGNQGYPGCLLHSIYVLSKTHINFSFNS